MRPRVTLGRAALAPALAFFLLSCRGGAPLVGKPMGSGLAAFAIDSRVILPNGGETFEGRVALNLEGDNGWVYRIVMVPQRAFFAQVEPGDYRLRPPRALIGYAKSGLRVSVGPWSFSPRLPPELGKLPPFHLKPDQVAVLGRIVLRETGSLPGQKPAMEASFDSSVKARRDIAQSVIHRMTDPVVSTDLREGAIAWLSGLERALTALNAQAPAKTREKSSSPASEVQGLMPRTQRSP